MAATTAAVIVVVIILVGVALSTAMLACLHYRRKRQMRQRYEQQLRDATRQRELEQQRWRERRLRDVVLLLIERGDAAEGVPLAVQMPGRREVSCRRHVRQLRHNPEREQLEEELREEAEAALPAEVRAMLHMPLSELLAHGRPVDAAPGPDIMQMLLDGQELTQLSVSSSESDSEWTDSVPASPSPPPPLLASAGHTTPAAPAAAALLPTTPTPHPPTTEDAHAHWQEERRAAILHELQVERQRAQRRRRTAEEVYGEGYDYLVNPNNNNNDHVSGSFYNGNDANNLSIRTSRRHSSHPHHHHNNNNNNSNVDNNTDGNNNASLTTGDAHDASTHVDLSQSVLRRLFLTPRLTLPRRGRAKGSVLATTGTPTNTPRLIAILPNEPSNISWSDPHSQRVNIPY